MNDNTNPIPLIYRDVVIPRKTDNPISYNPTAEQIRIKLSPITKINGPPEGFELEKLKGYFLKSPTESSDKI